MSDLFDTNVLFITNVAVPGRVRRQDVALRGGYIDAIADHDPTATEHNGAAGRPSTAVIDGTGRVVVPGFVDAHSHLDKSMLGRPWFPHPPRDMRQILADERALRTSDDWDSGTQIGRCTEVMIANGATHTRAFVDIDTDVKLTGMDGMLAVRERLQNALTMQIVAFAQSGIGDRPGTVELLKQALAAGADFVGGMDPCSYEGDPVGHLDLLFELAEQYGTGVDVHLHEHGELGAFSARLIAERARATELPRPVVISHPDFLGGLDPAAARRIVDELVDAGVVVTTCVPAGGPMPPLRMMVEAGLTIGVGCDGQRDSWGPFNKSDMLLKTYLLGWRYGFGSDEDLELALWLATSSGTGVMGVEPHRVAVGSPADLVLLPGDSAAEAVVSLATSRTVIKSGRVVAVDGALV